MYVCCLFLLLMITIIITTEMRSHRELTLNEKLINGKIGIARMFINMYGVRVQHWCTELLFACSAGNYRVTFAWLLMYGNIFVEDAANWKQSVSIVCMWFQKNRMQKNGIFVHEAYNGLHFFCECVIMCTKRNTITLQSDDRNSDHNVQK